MADVLKINELGVDTQTNEFVLVTNETCPFCETGMTHRGCEFVPLEGFVFVTDGDRMKSWRMQIIRTRSLRRATDKEVAHVIPWFHARIEEIANGDRRKKKPKKE